jgi:hypothetical protein
MRVLARSTVRSLFVALLALLGAIVLTVAMTITAAVNLAATTALIVPGTGTPDPSTSSNYIPNAVNYYVVPSTGVVCLIATCPKPVPYIAQFWPFPFAGWGGLSGAKWNVSVASGVDSLNQQLDAVPADNNVVIFGYSQGATVSGIVKKQLADQNGGLVPSNIQFVLIGDPNRPNGGLFERLAYLGTVPILDATFGQPTPTNTTVLPAVNTTDIALQYDGVADFPEYPINLLADLNALAGFWYIHGTYLAPKGTDPATETPYGYTLPELQNAMDCSQSPANCQTYNDTLYITIPAKTLPIMQPLIDIGAATGTSALVTPIVNLVSPTLRVLIETGYDRSNYGQPTPFRLIPIINPITLAVDLVAAAGQGIHDAFGVTLPSLTPPALSVPSPLSIVNTSAPLLAKVNAPDPGAGAQPLAPQLADNPPTPDLHKDVKITANTGSGAPKPAPVIEFPKLPRVTEPTRPMIRGPIGSELTKIGDDVSRSINGILPKPRLRLTVPGRGAHDAGTTLGAGDPPANLNPPQHDVAAPAA